MTRAVGCAPLFCRTLLLDSVARHGTQERVLSVMSALSSENVMPPVFVYGCRSRGAARAQLVLTGLCAKAHLSRARRFGRQATLRKESSALGWGQEKIHNIIGGGRNLRADACRRFPQCRICLLPPRDTVRRGQTTHQGRELNLCASTGIPHEVGCWGDVGQFCRNFELGRMWAEFDQSWAGIDPAWPL